MISGNTPAISSVFWGGCARQWHDGRVGSSYSAARNLLVYLLQFCRGQNADSICDLIAVKPRLPQPKAAVSPRLISAAVIRERGKDYNILFALFQMAAFVLERDTMKLANA